MVHINLICIFSHVDTDIICKFTFLKLNNTIIFFVLIHLYHRI